MKKLFAILLLVMIEGYLAIHTAHHETQTSISVSTDEADKYDLEDE